MAIAADVAIDYVNKIIGRDPSPTASLYTVNELYSYLMDTFDELTQMDDQVPMSAQTPTSYTMINGWYIREDLTRQLTTGAIQTTGYLDDVRTLICGVTGWTNFVPGDIGDLITGGTTTDTGSLLDYDNVNYKLRIRMTGATDTFDDASEAYTGAGTGLATSTAISITGEVLFANPYTLGSIKNAPTLYIYQDGAVIDWSGFDADQSWADGHFDILLKVTEGGTDIDSKAITVFAREFQELYSHFLITLTSAGQNAVPLGTSLDLNNETSEATVASWAAVNILGTGVVSDIDITYSFSSPYQYDIGDGAGVQDYDCQIDCNGISLANVYEVTKWATRRTSLTQLEIGADSTFINGEAYIYADSAYSPVVVAPFGTFAGGKFFGAQGVYFINLNANDAQAFQLIDNAATTRNPPNYQAFTVGSVETGDRVATYLETAQGSGIVDKAQYTLKAGVNALNALEILTTIPSDTPNTGTIIIVADDGTEIAYAYSSYTGKIFTVSITASTYSGGQNGYVPYLYEQATGNSVTETSTIFSITRYVVTKVRIAGIIPFVQSGIYSATGYTASAIRTTDSQYT